MLTFLAAASVSINIALEEPIRHTDNQEEIGVWIHRLSVTLMILFKNSMISDMVAEKYQVPAFTYGQLVLGISAEDI